MEKLYSNKIVSNLTNDEHNDSSKKDGLANYCSKNDDFYGEIKKRVAYAVCY